MTTTVRNVVTRALIDAGLVGAGETPDASEAAKALGQLNEMALGWPADGIHTGWSEVVLNDNFPFDEKHREGVTALLVKKILDNRGTPLSAGQTVAAERGFSRLCADFKPFETLRVDLGLQGMPSQRLGGWR